MSAKSDKIVAALKARAIAEAQQGNMRLFDSLKKELELDISDTGMFKMRKLTITLPVRDCVTLEQLGAIKFVEPDYIFENVEEMWWEAFGDEEMPEFENGDAIFLSSEAEVGWS